MSNLLWNQAKREWITSHSSFDYDLSEVLGLYEILGGKEKVIVVDLDGTLLEYDGFKGEDVFGDPLPGAVDAIKSLRKEGYLVVLYTCRQKTPKLLEYLNKMGFEFDGINTTKYNPKNTSTKPLGEFYIDDRALQFKGDWTDILNQIKQKVNSHTVFTISIPKVPVAEDIELWKETIEEVKKTNKNPEDSKEFVKEVLDKFREKGGLEKSLNINRPPEDIKEPGCLSLGTIQNFNKHIKLGRELEKLKKEKTVAKKQLDYKLRYNSTDVDDIRELEKDIDAIDMKIFKIEQELS